MKIKNNDDLKKGEWHNVTFAYNGNSDVLNLVIYYTKNIDGIDYQIQEQNGKIISKIVLKK